MDNPMFIIIVILLVICGFVLFIKNKFLNDDTEKKTEEEYAKETVDSMLVKQDHDKKEN